MALSTHARDREIRRRLGLLGGRRWWRRYGWSLTLVIEVVALIGLWEFVTRGLELWNPRFVPPPSEVVRELSDLIRNNPKFLGHVWFTSKNFMIGYGIGVFVGVVIGLGLGAIYLLDVTLGPFVWTAYAVIPFGTAMG